MSVDGATKTGSSQDADGMYKGVDAWKKLMIDEVFVPGLVRLRSMMQILQRQASSHKQALVNSGERANEAEKMVSYADAGIADIDVKGNGKKTHANSALQEYLKNHNWLKGDVNIDSELDKMQFIQIRGNIKKYATQNSEAVTRGQSQTQRLMATYNASINMSNELQTKCSELYKMMAQAIRG